MDKATHFFLGANSGAGFQNLFGPFCGREEHHDLLVLKGGPGVGKSTLMRRIGAAMEAKGEQVEYLYCSGDPDSLDGVNLPRIGAAVVDGTAPHVVEPRYPAAVDRYVDLGRFYNVEAAKAQRAQIVACADACSASYRRAYRALNAARQVEENLAALAAEHLDGDKLLRRGEGIASREIRGRGAGGGERYRFLGSVTCRGALWRFDTVERLCPRVYVLEDSWALARPLLEQLRLSARQHRYAAVVCPDPEEPSAIQHLLLPELELAFVTERRGMVYGGQSYRRVRVDAMVDAAFQRENRARLRIGGKLVETLREEAIAELRRAKEEHDRLEALYRPGVDFAGVSGVAERELQRLLSYC